MMFLMIIEKSKTYRKITKAEILCGMESLVTGGYATYKLFALEIANRENNYLL